MSLTSSLHGHVLRSLVSMVHNLCLFPTEDTIKSSCILGAQKSSRRLGGTPKNPSLCLLDYSRASLVHSRDLTWTACAGIPALRFPTFHGPSQVYIGTQSLSTDYYYSLNSCHHIPSLGGVCACVCQEGKQPLDLLLPQSPHLSSDSAFPVFST